MPPFNKTALDHLSKDRVMRKIIGHVGSITLKKDADLYLSLLRAIVGQQLSVKAAATIWKRFIAIFSDEYPSAEKVIALPEDTLRSVGLSRQKAGYIKNIAEFSLTNTLDYQKLKKLSDDELIEYLVQIKGVGRWTAEMLLMFNLHRMDVFPKDDLGVRLTMCRLYNIKGVKPREQHEAMIRIAEKWRPYRAVACHYLWNFKDGAVAPR
jgi:DNA-3-methyladenine glycosylase II